MPTVHQRYRRTDRPTTYDSNTELALRPSRGKNTGKRKARKQLLRYSTRYQWVFNGSYFFLQSFVYPVYFVMCISSIRCYFFDQIKKYEIKWNDGLFVVLMNEKLNLIVFCDMCLHVAVQTWVSLTEAPKGHRTSRYYVGPRDNISDLEIYIGSKVLSRGPR